MTDPSHHLPDGRFRNPWPEAAGDHAVRARFHEVVWEWLTTFVPQDPAPGALPVAEPDIARPQSDGGELRITWVGHATHLIQLPGLNLVTDPVWSDRAWITAKRFVPPSPPLEALPRLDGVLVSHDHYDHLDRSTVRDLRDRFGPTLSWYVPLGYRKWFGRLGIENVIELDWWDEHEIPDTGYRLLATPARHWTRRTPWGTNRRLWCSWAVVSSEDPGFRVYFGGDSGYASVFEEIGRRVGPFDASLLPIGAYAPRWFMWPSHMSPEEAVQVYQDLGAEGAFLASHWGTFRLSFEDPLEPPERLRAEWAARGLDDGLLHVPLHGETVKLRAGGRRRW